MTQPLLCIQQKDFASHPLLARLLTLDQIPEQIYVQGTLPDVSLDTYGRATPRILTVVGSRRHSIYGKDALAKIIHEIASQPIVIISGLALGIDGLAHRQALENHLVTCAIPGSGLHTNVLYPKTHLGLAKDILASNGCLISELPPDTPAAQWTFPARNRIMAALSDAILVVEAEEKSGTLITARLALELGKDIGVIPGSIFSPTGVGTNNLLRDGAYPITSGKDITGMLHLPHEEMVTHDSQITLTDDEEKLFSLVQEPVDKDTLLLESGMSPALLLSTLTSLEMKGYIQETFGEVRRIV